MHNAVWLKCRKREFSHRLHCIILAKIPEALTTNIDWLENGGNLFFKSSSVVEAIWNQSLCVSFFPFATICTGVKIRGFNKTEGNFGLFLNQSNVNIHTYVCCCTFYPTYINFIFFHSSCSSRFSFLHCEI